MTDPDRLPLHEELMLLALRDDKGTIAPGTMYQYAIAGAILSELMLRGRIGIEETKRKKLAKAIDTRPIGAPLLDECLTKIAEDKKQRGLDHWIGKFAGTRALKHRVAERLVDRGILREEEGKVLIVFSRRVYPETDPRPEEKIVARLRDAVFTDTLDVDPRTIVLLSLANKAGILKAVFDKKDLRRRKERIDKVVKGEIMGRAAKEAIDAMQTAVLVAAIIPTVVASTATH